MSNPTKEYEDECAALEGKTPKESEEAFKAFWGLA